jgi:glucosamine-phosphate N-acetyltransferase
MTDEDIRIIPVEKRFLKDVIQLLQDISVFLPASDELDDIWEAYSSQGAVTSIVAVRNGDEVVGFGTLLVETKIRGGKLGHIEDIVVSRDARGRGLGKKLISELEGIALGQDCYKLVLNCSERNIKFYEATGLEVNGVSMQRLF